MSSNYFPYWILLAAILLFVLEVFIPSGGVLGVLSAVAFVVAIGSAFSYGGIQLGTAFMGGTALFIPFLMYLMIKLWPRTPIGKRILIQQPAPGQLLPQRHHDRQQLIGQKGIALSPLLPAGAIRVQGRTFDAISDGITIEKGTPVEVVAFRNNAIVVRPTSGPVEELRVSADSNKSYDTVIPDPFDDTVM